MAINLTTRAQLTMDDDSEDYDVGRVNANSLKLDEYIGASPCTSIARPSTGLFVGRLAYETDTEAVIVWRDGTGWRYVGVPLVDSQAERDALGPTHEGLQCHRRDRNWFEFWDAAAWRVHGTAICADEADLAAITNPRSGQIAVTTDFDYVWQYDGGSSSWKMAGGTRTAMGLLAAPVAGTGNVAFGGETKIDEVTFKHTVGRYERCLFMGTFNLNASGSAIMRLRYVAGSGPVTTGGTLAYTGIATGSSATNEAMKVGRVLGTTFRALATGTYTVGVFAQAATGAASGTVLGSAGGADKDFTIEDIGAP